MTKKLNKIEVQIVGTEIYSLKSDVRMWLG